mgnify:CR=1 FL=1
MAYVVKQNEKLRGLLTDCLIGNVDDKDFTELFDSMKNYADLPEPIKHGNPKNDVSLGELLEMKGKPFANWREERKYSTYSHLYCMLCYDTGFPSVQCHYPHRLKQILLQ